jgi:hypothetical protein
MKAKTRKWVVKASRRRRNPSHLMKPKALLTLLQERAILLCPEPD